MKKTVRNILLLTACLWNLSAFALDERGTQRLEYLQQSWAAINYRMSPDERTAAFERLDAEARAALADAPDSAELMIWQAIIQASWAREKGGLGALDLVKKARANLETALTLDPAALDGSAYTSLGSLYYQVPGWPVAFGDDKRAEELLKKALELNPDGIDPNYFYGDYLLREKRYDESRVALLRARAAAARPGREVADEGRHAEIRALLAKLDKKLN
jgi:tetratricopeptide (TPR) repeat protein